MSTLSDDPSSSEEADLAADYLAMSQDAEREREANEWIEGLILDIDSAENSCL